MNCHDISNFVMLLSALVNLTLFSFSLVIKIHVRAKIIKINLSSYNFCQHCKYNYNCMIIISDSLVTFILFSVFPLQSKFLPPFLNIEINFDFQRHFMKSSVLAH